MRAGVHQKSYISLEVEVAGTALVGGTSWASIRPTPAIICIIATLQTTGGGGSGHVRQGAQGSGRELPLFLSLPNFA